MPLKGIFSEGSARSASPPAAPSSAGHLLSQPRAVDRHGRTLRELSADEPLLERPDRILGTGDRAQRGAMTSAASSRTSAPPSAPWQPAGGLVGVDRVAAAVPPREYHLRESAGDARRRDPLVDAAKPVARRLGPFLDLAHGFAAGRQAPPSPISQTIRPPVEDNDLIELARSFQARAASTVVVVPGAERRVPSPRPRKPCARRRRRSALGRRYTPEFVGWLDDFSSTTGPYDALGGFSRAWINLSRILYGPGPKGRSSSGAPALQRGARVRQLQRALRE